MKYAAFLRGINVGGNHKASMIEVRSSFESLGFTEVKSYINSGKYCFSTRDDSKLLRTSIILALWFTANIDAAKERCVLHLITFYAFSTIKRF